MKDGVEVVLLGHRLVVRTREDAGFVRAAANLVNEKMDGSPRRASKGSALHQALLATLNLAGDFLRLSEATRETQRKIRERIERLLVSMERQVGGFEESGLGAEKIRLAL